MSAPEKVGGQNTGRPLHFKKQGGMSLRPPTDLRPWITQLLTTLQVRK